MKKFLVLILFVVCCVPSAFAADVKIGIIGAMDIEVDSLKHDMDISSVITQAGMEFFDGKLCSVDAVVVKCGMGKVNAGICVQILIDTFKVTHIINTGVAGSLNNALNIGDIVAAVDAVQHDYDVTPIGFKRGEIPYTGLFAFKADDAMRAKAVKFIKSFAPDIQVIEGRICTGDQFIATKEQKNKITSAFGGDCCDMESGAIAQVCYLNHVPFLIIRAIADKADSSETADFHEFEANAAKLSASVTEHIVKNF